VPHRDDKKTPLVMELVLWSDKHVRDYHLGMNKYKTGKTKKALIIKDIQNNYRNFYRQLID